MTALELWTRAAIAVLIGGSLVVFIWFLRDLMRMGREWRGEDVDQPQTPPREGP